MQHLYNDPENLVLNSTHERKPFLKDRNRKLNEIVISFGYVT